MNLPIRPATAPAPPLPGGRLRLEPLIEALLADGVLAAEAARRARSAAREAQARALHPLVLLADLKLPRADTSEGGELDLETLTQWLAARCGLSYLRIDPTRIDVPRISGLVSLAYAKNHRILPVEVDAQRVVVATSEPLALDWMPDLRRLLRRKIELRVASPLDLARYTMEFHGITRSIRGAHEAKGALPGLPDLEQLVQLGSSTELGADDQHIVHLVDWMLQFAHEQRASDIHLEPRREHSQVRLRIDGVLHRVLELPTPVLTAVVARIKVLGRLDLTERRRPQDGRIKTRSPSGREVEMRLSTMPTAFGEKCVLRIFDPDTAFKPLDQLGFNHVEAAAWNELTCRPHGIVLVTGPTGSGKTTTLYSTLRRLATPDVNVCTIEDPIEMIAPELNQMQVQPSLDLGFASGVRTLLRQDPDIIMVGEIRDLETAQMAIQAALTGHLVLSTLHTNDAPSAVTRLLDLGVPHYLIASTLLGVLAQRLARTLCRKCKQPGALDPDLWRHLAGPAPVPEHALPMRPVGCIECRNTGFKGRTGLYELMVLSPALRARIRPEMELAPFAAAAVGEGMRTLRLAAAEKVIAGLTTIPEVLSVLPPPE
ncbi:MAG: type II secretion system protein E [Lysobacteraceae bacterium]|nr:MAG: type II secretion system protein E [Xanthomonadaceae bacterium]